MNEKIMPLSQAIRLGATMKPQGFRALYTSGKTCAYGAALDAIGVDVASGRDWPLPEEWCAFLQVSKSIACPGCGSVVSRRSVVSTHLNDMHHWTRERIADWVELNLEPLPLIESSVDTVEVQQS